MNEQEKNEKLETLREVQDNLLKRLSSLSRLPLKPQELKYMCDAFAQLSIPIVTGLGVDPVPLGCCSFGQTGADEEAMI